MVQSQYLLDILDLALEDDNATQSELIKQTNHLTEREREHTGIGLYVYFDNKSNPSITKTDDLFNGVIIENESQNIEAEATIHIIVGLIESIEIFNRTGTTYPTNDLKSYYMYQSWIDEDKRRVIKR